MLIRPAESEEADLIYRFIQNKAEFDRSIDAYSGVIQTNVSKIKNTLLENILMYSYFAGQSSIWLDDLFVNPDMGVMEPGLY